jgi:hypothetical protein
MTLVLPEQPKVMITILVSALAAMITGVMPVERGVPDPKTQAPPAW